MTVQSGQVAAAQMAGLLDGIAIDAAEVANTIPMPYYMICSLIEKETTNGKNCYGNDAGGTFSGFKDLVTEANWRAFRHEVVVRGRPSNGVGPVQLTYRGFYTDMESKGLKPWAPRDNILYGAGLLWSYFKARRAAGLSMKSSIRWAGTFYNAGTDEAEINAYGDRFFDLTVKWRVLVGVVDVGA